MSGQDEAAVGFDCHVPQQTNELPDLASVIFLASEYVG